MEVVAGLLCHGPWLLCLRRGPGERHAGAWEFPGGKVQAGESLVEALARELEEELGLAIAPPTFLGTATGHRDGAAPFALHGFSVRGALEALTLTVHDRAFWVPRARLNPAALLPADRDLYARLPILP